MNKNKVTFAIFLAVILIAAAILFTYVKSSQQDGSILEYKLAVFIPETGNLAFIGQPIRNALTIAVEEHQDELQKTGVHLQMLWVDTQGKPREAVTAFNRVVEVEGADAVLTTLSGVTSAIAPLAKSRSILLVGLTVEPTFLIGQQTAIRVFYSFEQEGEQLANEIMSSQWRDVLILHSTDAATDYEINKVLIPALRGGGISPTVDTFNVGQRDFKDLCAKYSTTPWNGIVLHGFGSELPFISETCSAYPDFTTAPKLGSLGCVDVKPELRPHMIGTRFFAPSFYAEPSDSFQSFSSKYSARYPGQRLSYAAVYAYDAFKLVVDSLKVEKSTDPATIMRHLAQPRMALTQEYQFNASGDTRPESILFEFKQDGTFEPTNPLEH